MTDGRSAPGRPAVPEPRRIAAAGPLLSTAGYSASQSSNCACWSTRYAVGWIPHFFSSSISVPSRCQLYCIPDMNRPNLPFAMTRFHTSLAAMTDRPSSPIADHAEFVFCAETRSPHYYPSIAALIVLVEVMLATVVAEETGEEIDRITRLEAHRKSSASYIEY